MKTFKRQFIERYCVISKFEDIDGMHNKLEQELLEAIEKDGNDLQKEIDRLTGELKKANDYVRMQSNNSFQMGD